MKNNKGILISILKTVQSGQSVIRSVIEETPGNALKSALYKQLEEYRAMEQEVFDIAQSRGWKMKKFSPMSQIMSDAMNKGMLTHDQSDSRIADMLIWDNTRRMIDGIRTEHQNDCTDPRIGALATKLISCENNNIQQMKEYL